MSTKHSPKRSKFKRSNVVSTSLKGAVNDSQHSRTCGGQGAISPQVSKIGAKFKFFGQSQENTWPRKYVFEQRYEKLGQGQEF